MKKKLIVLSLFYVSLSYSQLDSIKNPNFDSWTGDNPSNWGSSNMAVTGSVDKATGGDVLGPNTLMLTTKLSGGTLLLGTVVSNGAYTGSGTKRVGLSK